MVNIKELKQLIKEQNQTWIKVGDFEFLYKKMGGEEMIKIGSKQTSIESNSVYVDILINSIVNWKNVKVKDILGNDIDHENKEEYVEFDRELFDQFLSVNLGIVGDLFKGIDSAQQKSNEVKSEIIQMR